MEKSSRAMKSKIHFLFSNYWISILIIGILAVLFIIWLSNFLPYSDIDAARWTLSALTQSVAALVGLIIVSITLLWSQAITEENNLRKMKKKYLWILMNMYTEPAPMPEKGPIIEQLRRDYFEKIKSESLFGKVFPYKHKKYKDHIDLFLEICALTEFFYSYSDVGGGTRQPQIDTELKVLSLANKSTMVYMRSLILKGHVVEFFDVLYNIFTPANLALDELKHGRALSNKIWHHFLNDNIDLGLERIRRFRRFKGIFFKINIFAFILTLAVGLLVLSSLSDLNFTPYALLPPMTLGLISIALLTITLNRLLHSD